jgi:NAD+--dinitrogen-reductase ADP-D-ribosyltransferase
MNTDKNNVDIFNRDLVLPDKVFQSLNHCNLPARVIGSLQFQHHPQPLSIDGIKELHQSLYDALDQLSSVEQRAQKFIDYMDIHFRLYQLEDAGLEKDKPQKRTRADYLHMLRGWLFDPNSREGAVLKSWVESRFGLLTRYHKGPLNNQTGHLIYREACSQGLYGTNALEAQIDLLYSYCQYELSRQLEHNQRLSLYRGINHLDSIDVLQQLDKKHAIVLLNNLNSFSSDKERADEFGDLIIVCQVPWQKILCYSNLLPGRLEGESEYLVMGGVYEVFVTREV